MRRPQFSLKMLLWLMLCVACFCAGVRFERSLEARRKQAAFDFAFPVFKQSQSWFSLGLSWLTIDCNHHRSLARSNIALEVKHLLSSSEHELTVADRNHQ